MLLLAEGSGPVKFFPSLTQRLRPIVALSAVCADPAEPGPHAVKVQLDKAVKDSALTSAEVIQLTSAGQLTWDPNASSFSYIKNILKGLGA